MEELFDQKVDLIFTGEGSLDKQTVEGKVIKGISEVSKKVNIPFSIISRVVNDEELILDKLKPFSIKSILGLNVSKEEAMNNASKYVTDLTIETLKLFNKR